jgi:hypothetical protein
MASKKKKVRTREEIEEERSKQSVDFINNALFE